MSKQKAFLLSVPGILGDYTPSFVILADSKESAIAFAYGGADGDVAHQIVELPLMRQEQQLSDEKKPMSFEEGLRNDLQALVGAKCVIYYHNGLHQIGVIKEVLHSSMFLETDEGYNYSVFSGIVSIHVWERPKKDEK